MQTYSHLLIGIWLRARLTKRGTAAHTMMIFGSSAPDAPLTLLTLWHFWQQYGLHGSGFPLFGPEYDARYFHDPLWLAAHNVLHSPTAAALWLALGWFAGVRRGSRPWTVFFWFAAGCALHSLIDVATHHDDGPLLWFPFDWETRFHSPISYWDRRHYAGVVSPIEHALDALILVWAAAALLRRRKAKLRQTAAQAAERPR